MEGRGFGCWCFVLFCLLLVSCFRLMIPDGQEPAMVTRHGCKRHERWQEQEAERTWTTSREWEVEAGQVCKLRNPTLGDVPSPARLHAFPNSARAKVKYSNDGAYSHSNHHKAGYLADCISKSHFVSSSIQEQALGITRTMLQRLRAYRHLWLRPFMSSEAGPCSSLNKRSASQRSAFGPVKARKFLSTPFSSKYEWNGVGILSATPDPQALWAGPLHRCLEGWLWRGRDEDAPLASQV